MNAAFTIFNNGVEQTLAAWGLDDLRFSDNDLAPSTVEFTAGGRAVDASDLFAYGSRVIIFQNRTGSGTSWSGGSCWFDGRVEPWERDGTAGAEDCIGRIVNAWWYFDRIQYKMQFIRATGTSGTTTYTTNRVILGVGINLAGTSWVTYNTGGQIAAAVNWAISQGAPVTLGNVAPWAPVVSDFQKCIKVSQVIEKMWHIESDFTVIWDYSTVGTNTGALGTPTIHFLKCSIANLQPGLTTAQQNALILTPITINLDAGNWLSGVKIKPRPDWIKSYVHIDYDQITTFGSNQYLSLGDDQYPVTLPTDTESKFNGVDLYFDLSGAKVSVTTQQGNLTSAPFDPTSLAQWQTWKNELNAATVASAVIITGSTMPAATVTHPAPTIVATEIDSTGTPVAYNSANAYELLDGCYADWMADSTLMGSIGVISAQKVKVTAWAYITYKNGAVAFKQFTKELTAISFNTANVAETITVQTKTVTTYAEPQPVGLAQILYNAWRSLAVEGSFSTLDTEIGASTPQISRANCLNFTSAALAPHAGDGTILDWSAVNAPVRRVSGSAVKGTYTVEFGAPLHLTANALIDLVRASRVRVTSVDLNYLFGGPLSSGGGTVQHPRKTHAHSAEHGADEPEIHVTSAHDATSGNFNLLTADGTQNQILVQQTNPATGTVIATGLIAPEYSGGGPPSASTLVAGAYYRQGAHYIDTSANALWRCTASGTNSSSTWAQISGGGGSISVGAYNNATAYSIGNIVFIFTTTTIGGVTILPGCYICVAAVPAGGTGNQVPQYPMPTGTVYWFCIAMGINEVNTCSGGSSANIYINSSGSF